MQDIINSVSTYGYIVLFLYSLGGGMVALIAAGILSFAGKMDITLSIIVAAVANTIGDTLKESLLMQEFWLKNTAIR